MALFGIIIAVALIYVIEMIGHNIYPPPPDTDLTDPEALGMLLAGAPIGALLFVILAYVIAVFGGGLLAALIARETPTRYVWTVGGFVLLGTVANLFMIPHPAWFVITAIACIVVAIMVTGRVANNLVEQRER